EAGISEKFDPDCGCAAKDRGEKTDGTFIVKLGRLTLRAGFSERNGFLYFPDLRARIPARAAHLEYATVRLKPGMLPRHLVFLANLADEHYVTRFIPEDVPAYVGEMTEAGAEAEPEAE